MPRPSKPGALTPTERSRASRLRHGNVTVSLPAAVICTLDAIACRDGDASRVAAVARLVEAAREEHSPASNAL